MAQQAERVFIITNNHFAGKAVVNAVQLQHLTTARMPNPPESLIRLYPVLNRSLQGK
jgi:hypothetical protein